MSKQQTAVDWIWDKIVIEGITNYTDVLVVAKQMEREQIVDAANLPKDKRWYNAENITTAVNNITTKPTTSNYVRYHYVPWNRLSDQRQMPQIYCNSKQIPVVLCQTSNRGWEMQDVLGR